MSRNNKYLALTGVYAVSACPSVPEVVYTRGFITIVDMETKAVVFVDYGGEGTDSTAHFAWLRDNTIVYTIDDFVNDVKSIIVLDIANKSFGKNMSFI